MRKRGLCLILALLCALLCACENQPPAQTAETAASRPPEELVLLSDEVELMEVCIRAAQEKYGVRVTLADAGNDAYEQMLLDFAAGRATYDVVCVSNALGNLYTADGLIDRGYFAPLSGCGQVEESVAHMLPVLRDCVTRDGVIYALPCVMRTKVLTYNRPLYDAKADGSTERYYARTGETVTNTWLQQIPEMREFTAWNELFTEMPLRDGVLASNAILEQFILSADEEGFTFDCPQFRDALALMKMGSQLNKPAAAAPAAMDINNAAYFIEVDKEGTLVLECDDVYAPPTIDAQNRLAMTYTVLAVNVFSEKQQEALRFLECAADSSLYGTADAAACYADDDHVRLIAGDDPDNRRRWRELTQRLVPITDAGYLTSFYLEIYPMYLDGAITAEQCARMTQERYEMYKAEQGK